MIVSYNSESKKLVNLQVDNNIYKIYPGEKIDINVNAETNANISIQDFSKKNIVSLILLFIQRFSLIIFRMLIMDYPKHWAENLDPYEISIYFIIKNKLTTIKYNPPVFDKTGNILRQPEIIVDGEIVKSSITFEPKLVQIHFLTYCFDLISLCLYGLFIITFIFVFSGQMMFLIYLYSVIVLGITLPIVFKIISINKRKNKLIENINAIEEIHVGQNSL